MIHAGTGGTTEWYIQQGRVYTLETEDDAVVESDMLLRGIRMPSPGNGFGMHLVNVSNHVTTGGLTVSAVETQFTKKLGDMSSFDAFMDFNAQYYTSALETYIEAFEADDVPLFKTQWDYEDKTWTSVFVHVPNTQLTMELIQDVQIDGVTETSAVPRIGAKAYAVASAVTTSSSSKILTPLNVNRAVSSSTMKKLDDFYVTGMRTEKVDVIESGDVSRACYLWTGASVNICFYNRPDSATKGDWKVGDFEDMLNTVHSNTLGKNPLCGEDKWFDNHYAIDSRTHDTSNIVPYVESNNVLHCTYCYIITFSVSSPIPLVKHTNTKTDCSAMGPFSSVSLHYVIDPTGWGIQTDLSFDSTPSDCYSSSSTTLFSTNVLGGTFNPACDPGTCTSS